MTINAYERPREKLLKKGVAALTNTELLQVIIGSGNAGMPVTKIARKVSVLFVDKGAGVTFDELLGIRGLGKVKAGQIIAGLELTVRLLSSLEDNGSIDILDDLYADIRTAKKPMVLYAFFDGSGRLIHDHSQYIEANHTPELIVRILFAEALSKSTASILIAVGFDNQSLEPTMFELGLARNAYHTASLLSIPLKLFMLVSNKGAYSLKEARDG